MLYEDAIRFILDKNPNPQEWDASAWASEESAVKIRSFFSSQVENARFLDRAQAFIFDYMAGTTEKVVSPDGTQSIAIRAGGRAEFVRAMRQFMIKEGMATEDEMRGSNQNDLTDIKSENRLRLIFDTNVRQAYGYGNWKQGMTPAVLRRFPAARFIRKRNVGIERERHAAHENEVRLKTDRAWWADYQNDPLIGGFGVPWEPYGFNSGMGQQDVSREQAINSGLPIDLDDDFKKNDAPGLNTGMSASVKKMNPDVKKRLLEELRKKREGLGNKTAEDFAGEAVLRIREENDRILLEDLNERAAKAKKRFPDATPEQERAIAQSLFERIDRKSSNPKTRAGNQKGANRAKELFRDEPVLTTEERLMLKSPLEILAVYSPDGRLKQAKLGTKNNVKIPPDIEAGSVLTHNHPGGKGASSSDLRYALKNPENTLRIVTQTSEGKSIYSLKALDSLPKETIEEIVTLYRKTADGLGDTRAARLDALSLILQDYGEKFSASLKVIP